MKKMNINYKRNKEEQEEKGSLTKCTVETILEKEKEDLHVLFQK